MPPLDVQHIENVIIFNKGEIVLNLVEKYIQKHQREREERRLLQNQRFLLDYYSSCNLER